MGRSTPRRAAIGNLRQLFSFVVDTTQQRRRWLTGVVRVAGVAVCLVLSAIGLLFAGGLAPAQARTVSKPPLALTLRTTKVDAANPGSTGIGVELYIVNTSKELRRFFKDDGFWHNSELVLKDVRGKRVKAFNSRSVRSVSAEGAAQKKSHLEALAPGKRLLLGSGQVYRAKKQRCSLRWGPSNFPKLAQGTYKAQAIWRRRTQRYYDMKERRWSTAKDAWLGTLRSPEIKLHITGCAAP